jgi:uncharacterized protein
LTGTLGLLLDAKKAGFVTEIRPLLEKLQSLNFRVASRTFAAALRLADEAG